MTRGGFGSWGKLRTSVVLHLWSATTKCQSRGSVGAFDVSTSSWYTPSGEFDLRLHTQRGGAMANARPVAASNASTWGPRSPLGAVTSILIAALAFRVS